MTRLPAESVCYRRGRSQNRVVRPVCGHRKLWREWKCPCSCCRCSHAEVCLIFDGFSQWTLLSLTVSAHFSANQHSPNRPGCACRPACSSGFGGLHGSTFALAEEIYCEFYLVCVWAASWAHLGQPDISSLQETPSKRDVSASLWVWKLVSGLGGSSDSPLKLLSPFHVQTSGATDQHI